MTVNVVSVMRPHELVESQLSGWRDFQLADERLANPFLAPEFTLAVGRARSNARVAVIESGGTLAGFFPFERGALGVGRAMGSGLADCQAVVHAPDLRLEAQDLTAGCGLAALEFDHLLAHQTAFAPYHVASNPSPVIDVSSGFEHYIAERSRLDKEVRRNERILERDFGPVTFDFDARDAECLRLLMRWKSAQYRRTGRFDRFANRSVVQVVESLMQTRASGCAGILSVLYAAGQPVAIHFGLRSRTVLSSWFPAYDVKFARYSPGLVLLRRIAEASAASGLFRIDLGKGHEKYKEQFKNRDIAVAEGWVDRPTAAAVLRRVQRMPRRFLVDFILSRPALRRGARRALRGLGYVRNMG